MILPHKPELMGTQSALHDYASCRAASRQPPQPATVPTAGVSSPATPEHSTAAEGGAASPSSITYLSGCSAPSPADARADRAGSTNSSELESTQHTGGLQALLLAPQLVAPSTLPLLPPPTGAYVVPQVQSLPSNLQQQVARQQQQLQLQFFLKSQLQQQQQQVKKRQLVPLSAADAPKGAASTMLVLAPPGPTEPRPAAAAAAADPSFSAGFAAGVLQGLAAQAVLPTTTALQGGVQKKAAKQRQRQRQRHTLAAYKPCSPAPSSLLGATRSTTVLIDTLPVSAAPAAAAAAEALTAGAAAGAMPPATAVAMCCSISDLLGTSSSEEAAVRLSKLSRAELFQFARQAVGGGCTPQQLNLGQQASQPAACCVPGGGSSCVPGACTPAQIAAGCCRPAAAGPGSLLHAPGDGSSRQGVQAMLSSSGGGSISAPLLCTPEQMLAGCCSLEQVASGQCILVPSLAAGTASRPLPQLAATAPASPGAGTGACAGDAGAGAGLAAGVGTAGQPRVQAMLPHSSSSSKSDPLPKLCTPEQLAAGGCCSPEQVLSGSCLLVEADELAARLAAISPGCPQTAAVAAAGAGAAGCRTGRSSSAILPPAVELMAFYSQPVTAGRTPAAAAAAEQPGCSRPAPPAAVAGPTAFLSAAAGNGQQPGVGLSMQPLLQHQPHLPPHQLPGKEQQQYCVLADLRAEPMPSYEDMYLSWQQEQGAADGMDWAGHDLL